jgi:hypothetical protein
MPDLLPGITCFCAEPKFEAAAKCVAACGSIASGAATQRENLCKDPQAALSALAAKFGGGKFTSGSQLRAFD